MKINDYVYLKVNHNKKGRIIDILDSNGETYYDIEFNNFEREIFSKNDIEPIKIQSIREILSEGSFISFEEFNLNFLLKKIYFQLSGKFYSTNATTANFLPHQFRPLIKILESETGRLLIADEVGVGKTIEAGYIISELLARSEIFSVLIICPKSLVLKWKNEMKRFFDEDFEIIESARDLMNKLEFREKFPKLIVGLELMRRSEIVDLVSTGFYPEKGEKTFIPFDLLLVDEAHHLRNPSTNSYKLVKSLLQDVEYALFLTATPINTKIEDLYNLLNLLVYQDEINLQIFEKMMAPNRSLISIQKLLDLKPHDLKEKIKQELIKLKTKNEFSRHVYEKIKQDKKLLDFLQNPDPRNHQEIGHVKYKLESINQLSAIFTNTRKRDIVNHESMFPIRRPDDPLEVYFNDIEMEFYWKARSFFIDIIKRRADGEIPVNLVDVMPQRIIASSIQGTFKKLEQMINKARFEFQSEEREYQEEENAHLQYTLTKQEIERAKDLLLYRDLIGDSDSKFGKVLERIKAYFQAGNRRIIIFSFFKNTIEYITEKLNNTDFSDEERHLERKIKAGFIHGDIPPIDREKIFKKFENEDIQILVLSNIGAEGIDLQYCNCLINYDLPWNPMKLEQRIGRLDRYGQKNAVLITNVYVVNSIEDRILYRLFKRINIVQENLLFLNPILKNFLSEKNLIFQPEKSKEDLDIIIPKIEENLAARKNYIKEIQEKIEEIKGPTSKALFYEAGLIEEKRKLITQRELLSGFQHLLKNIDENVSFKKINEDPEIMAYCERKKITEDGNIYYLESNEDFLEKIKSIEVEPVSFRYELEAFTQKIKYSLIKKNLRYYSPVLFTWNPKTAIKYKNQVELFSLKHVFAKALINMLEKIKNIPDRFCAAINIKDSPLKNDILIFIFLLKSTGIQKVAELKVACFDLKKQEIIEDEISEQIFKKIFTTTPENVDNLDLPNIFSSTFINKAFLVCFNHISSIKKEMEKEISSKVKETYEYKKIRIKQSFERKIQTIEDKLNKATDKRIIRMFNGQLRNTKNRMVKNLADLKEKYKNSLSISIVEVGALYIKA
ncbi:MAG: DEAD/DEAH box helicase [Promethearchaeota archaeon]